MSTRYYLRHPACECCGRRDPDQLICNNLTTFAPAVITDDYGRQTIVAGSWQEWKTIIKLSGGKELVNEYEEAIDKDDFIRRVEAVDPVDRRRHFEFCKAHAQWRQGVSDKPDLQAGVWLDPDGFSFVPRLA